MNRKLRILMAKPGLDGHDRGAKVIARTFRDAGMEVVDTRLHQTPEQIVSSAIQESVDVIAISILSGAHLSACRKVMQGLAQKDAEDITVIVGGTILDQDIAKLKDMGVAEVFTPGAPLEAGLDFLRQRFNQQ